MRTRSVKRAKQEREYLKIRDKFLLDNPTCEPHSQIWVTRMCAWSTEVHHKKGRIGDLLTDVTFFLPVCRECHQWIEDNPKLAKEKGYSLSRLANEPHQI